MGLTRLANLGVQLGVSPVSKEQFAESLVESATAAGFAELDGDQVIFVRPADDPEYGAMLPHEREPEMRVEVARPRVADESGRRRFRANFEAAAAERERAERPVMEGPVYAQTRRVLRAPSALDDVEEESLERISLRTEERQSGPRDENMQAAVHHYQWNTTPEQKPVALHQQSWEIPGGSLTFEIRSDRSLPAEAFMQIGKVMSEVEKLKELLTKGAESVESTE